MLRGRRGFPARHSGMERYRGTWRTALAASACTRSLSVFYKGWKEPGLARKRRFGCKHPERPCKPGSHGPPGAGFRAFLLRCSCRRCRTRFHPPCLSKAGDAKGQGLLDSCLDSCHWSPLKQQLGPSPFGDLPLKTRSRKGPAGPARQPGQGTVRLLHKQPCLQAP